MERAGPCPVKVDNDVVEQLQVTPGEDSSSSTEVSSSSTEVSSPLNVSSFIRQGKDFPIIKVTGELTIKSKNGEEPYGMTVLDDESILICYESGVARYDKAGLLLGHVKKDTEEFSFPSDVCKLTDGKVLVLDRKGFHLLDKSLLFIKTLKENRTAAADKSGNTDLFCSLAEDEDGNILTLHNRFTGESTPTRASVFIFEMKNEEFNEDVKVIPLEPLIDEAMVQLDISDPNASRCGNLSYRDGRMYITGDKTINSFIMSVFTKSCIYRFWIALHLYH